MNNRAIQPAKVIQNKVAGNAHISYHDIEVQILYNKWVQHLLNIYCRILYMYTRAKSPCVFKCTVIKQLSWVVWIRSSLSYSYILFSCISCAMLLSSTITDNLCYGYKGLNNICLKRLSLTFTELWTLRTLCDDSVTVAQALEISCFCCLLYFVKFVCNFIQLKVLSHATWWII